MREPKNSCLSLQPRWNHLAGKRLPQYNTYFSLGTEDDKFSDITTSAHNKDRNTMRNSTKDAYIIEATV